MEASDLTRVHDAFDYLETRSGIHAFRMGNGLRVLVLEQPSAPVACLMVTYGVGSRNEGAGLTGATHFLEHLMFKGTERYHARKGTSVFQTLQSVGAQINATTWLDRTNYFAVLPTEHLALAADIEADRMRGVLLEPEAVASEKTVILNELDRGQNEPFRNLYHHVWAAAFPAHPYGHPTIGWRSDVEAVTPEGLRGFYDTFYWPGNATVSIIGGVSVRQALVVVDEHFGPIPAPNHDIPDVTTREPDQRGERRVILRQAGTVDHLILGWKAPEATHADAPALDLLAVILGTGKGSRLYDALVDTGLATHASASAPSFRDPGLFTVLAMLTPGKTHDEVERAIRGEVERIQTEGVAPGELERALGLYRAHEAYARDGVYAAASRLNEAIAAGDWTLFTDALARAQAVTPGDVQRAAQTYLIPDALTVGLHHTA
jgi:zinc protease